MNCPHCHKEIKPRSIAQNRAYFGLAVERLAEHYSVEQKTMHKALAGAYFGFEEVDMGGLIIKVPKSTTGITTKEFKEYYEWIQKLAAERGVNIHDPNEPDRYHT